MHVLLGDAAVRPLAHPPDADVTVPGSKSLTNRALVLAALSDGPSTVRGALRSRDSLLMAAALERLGVPDEPGVDADAVRRTGVVELLGGGRPVGSVRAVF